MSLTPSEEAEFRTISRSCDLPMDILIRSRQIAENIEEDVSLYAEVVGAF